MVRKLTQVLCKECNVCWNKRVDTLKEWQGFCKSCASKDISKRPEIKEARRLNGIKVMKQVGKLPHYYNRNYRFGPANNKWRGGITSEIMKIRHSLEMKEWRKSVFERDDYTCEMCDQRGGDLHADHIQPFSLFPDLRFETENGRTLCVDCHRKFGVCVSNGKITRECTRRTSDGTNWVYG